MRNPRALLAAGVVAVAVVAGVVLLTVVVGDSDGEGEGPPRPVRASLTLEQFTRLDTAEPELLVSLATPQLNTLETTGAERVVLLRCSDATGTTIIRQPAEWPLEEEVGFLPHIHQPASRKQLDSVRACTLTGPGIDFEGRVAGRLPQAQ